MTAVKISNSAWKKIAKDTESTLYQVLQKAIPDKINDLNDDQRVQLMLSMYSLIMHRTTFVEMKKLVKYCGLETKDAYVLFHCILENYEANLGLKQVTFICLNNTRQGIKSNYEKMLKQSELSLGNELLLKALPDLNFGATRLLARVKEKPLLLPNQIKRNCAQTMKDINPFITHFAYGKLTFIAKHNNFDHKDLIADLVRKGVETYYRLTPMQTPLHRENSVKNAIHNHGMKMISFYTSKKRARIEKTGEGEYSTKIDSIVGLNNVVDEKRSMDNDWQVPTLKFELRRFVEQYNARNARRASIVSKLICEDIDEKFTRYVSTRLGSPENLSMEEINFKRPKLYVSMISEYHQVPELTIRRIALEFLNDYNGYKTNSL